MDTAYVRLKRYFGYKTFDERKRTTGSPEWLQYSSFRHETLPGVRYWMRDAINLRVISDQTQHGWMATQIEREGQQTRVQLDYCIGGAAGFAGGPGLRYRLLNKTERIAKAWN